MRGLALAAILAMTSGVGVVGTEFPITRRRAEKDAIALAKAEAKRERRAAKKLKNMGPNAAIEGAEGGLPPKAPARMEG